MNKFDYENLSPFKWFVLENFPFIEADFDALTEWQLFCKLGKEINKIIDSQNIVGEQAETLTNAFNNLKNYVDNYFDNLDIKEEVNNKLNEMAESGELAELISQYLESQAIIGFNNISDLANATNLANGSIARTLGRNQYNDGYGAFYKIRQRTNSDTPDGYNIIVLTNTENLVAEKILNQSIINLENEVEELKKVPTKKYIFVGDSYLQGYTPSGEVENWGKKLANMLGLEDNQWKRVAKGGTAMNSTNTNNFFNLISEQTSDNDVTDVILCAGYNDHQDIGTEESILSGMQLFKNKVLELYPNATLKIGFIGNTSIVQDKYGVSSKCPLYIKACSKLNINYLNNVEYALHNYNTEFATDGIHPNNLGEQVIAEAIYQAIKTGSAHIYRPRTPVKQAGSSFYFEQENNILKFICNDFYAGGMEEKTITMNGGDYILMYEQFDNSLAVSCGSSHLSNSTTIPVFFVTTDNKTLLVNCKVTIDNGFLVLYPFALNENGSNYLTVTIKGFQIRPFTYVMDALYN